MFVSVGGVTLFVEDHGDAGYFWCTDANEEDYYIQEDQVEQVLATIIKEEDMPK